MLSLISFRAQTEVTLRLEALGEPHKQAIPSAPEEQHSVEQKVSVKKKTEPTAPQLNQVIESNGYAVQPETFSLTDTWQDVKELLSIEEGWFDIDVYPRHPMPDIAKVYTGHSSHAGLGHANIFKFMVSAPIPLIIITFVICNPSQLVMCSYILPGS